MSNKLFELQKAIKPIVKDSTNPFFKSKYFDINTLIADIKPIINKLGLIIMQPLNVVDGKQILTTFILDAENGEKLAESNTLLPENPDPQKMGAIITYFRRYALQSILLLEAEDDDANSATGHAAPAYTQPASKPQTATTAIQAKECQKCGAEMVLNPKTQKWFCSDRCWLKN